MTETFIVVNINFNVIATNFICGIHKKSQYVVINFVNDQVHVKQYKQIH